MIDVNRYLVELQSSGLDLSRSKSVENFILTEKDEKDLDKQSLYFKIEDGTQKIQDGHTLVSVYNSVSKLFTIIFNICFYHLDFN